VTSDKAIPTAELNKADVTTDAEADRIRGGQHRWTRQEAQEAARLSRESRATRREREPPSDAEIERGLRERAVSDPRAAEILLRWMQRPLTEERVDGVDLDSLSERELERLHAGLLKVAALPEVELRALVGSLLEGTKDA
jgi:hypothetical protein